MKKICVIGHFGFGRNLLNGQTIKTKMVTCELERKYGVSQIKKIDTHGGVKSIPKIIVQMLGAFTMCDNIIIFPAHNGIKLFVPLCSMLNMIFHRKLHYIVIGGWLPTFLQDRTFLRKQLRRFYKIYVETNTVRTGLEKLNLENVIVMPNFKNIQIVEKENLKFDQQKPYKLCVFSRIMKEKGIEDAINSVIDINKQLGEIVYTLDIYGQVETEQQEWFEALQKSFPEYINYKGLVAYDESVYILKEYFALLFPTKFYTEGIPGTILDAYAAGLPVISSKWESFEDLIDDGITGIGYEFDNETELVNTLKLVAENPEMILSKKEKCIAKAKEFQASEVVQKLFDNL